MTQPRRCRLPLTDQAKLEGEVPKLCYQDNCQGCTVWNILQQQLVREAISKLLFNELGKGFRWQELLPIADQILNLFHPSGAPMLAVLDEDQELPDNRAFNVSTNIEFKSFMLKAGWRKTIP